MELRDIPGQPGYQCSRDGRVFSLKQGAPRELALFARDGRAYLGVNLTHGGKFRTHRVHRLVALAWVGAAPSPQHIVMHADDNPANNHALNLSWGLPRDNSAQMVRKGRSARGERVGGAKLTPDAVRSIRQRFAAGEKRAHIAAELGMALSTICDICNRSHWKHIE